MKKFIACTVLGVAALSVATTAAAQSSIEDAIKFRQAGYAFMAWNMGKIKAQVVDGAVPYNKDQVAAAANAIAAIANSGMGALYPAGSDQGTGYNPTRLKSEFFQNMQEVGQIATNFNAAANELASVAAGGDQNAIKAAFGKVGETCKACHDKFRAPQR
ncbi:cytochrome c [Pseudothauera nasutitermitis]|uniref:Cytochrome c n=1 Tax=Pseudothauera nasutitermitis TaxID=2565930 RepID=A0A4S4AY21_9RHOO|nr:cytochrome c [Pseudothauera nasutitermitis]THF64536.1 cytochrome c [Pseudothauera nasutitermitis]